MIRVPANQLDKSSHKTSLGEDLKNSTMAIPKSAMSKSDCFINAKLDATTQIQLILSLVIVAAYSLLHTNLNVYYEDDSWTLSNAWNYMQLGLDYDVLFLDQDGAFTGQLFGKLYFFFCGTFLNLFGWTKSNAFVFNSSLVIGTAFIWHYILKVLPFSKNISRILPFFIPVFPPVFFAAHTGRTDAFTFLLMSIGILLFIRKHYFAAGLIAMLAIETHIMGVVTLFYYASHFIYRHLNLFGEHKDKKVSFATMAPEIGKSALGLLTGIGIYSLLHYQVFDMNALSKIISSKADMVSPVNNYILAYFTDFDWSTHLPEFFLLIYTIGVYIKGKLFKENKFLLILLAVLFISTIITRRENRNYIIYLTPAILMLYFYVYEKTGKMKYFIPGMLMLVSFYFAQVYYKNHNFNFKKFVTFVDSNTSAKNIPVVGMPDVWFTAMEKEFYPIHNERDFNKITLDEFYLVETDYLSHRSRMYNPVKENIYLNYDCIKLNEWLAYANEKAAVCHCKKNANPKVDIVYKPYPGWQEVVKNFMPSSLF